MCDSQILSKGKIIQAGRMDITGQLVTNIGLMVTPDMMPSFRIVAYYTIPWMDREEVVSDSVWIDVVDSCLGGGVSPQLSHSLRRYSVYQLEGWWLNPATFSLRVRVSLGVTLNPQLLRVCSLTIIKLVLNYDFIAFLNVSDNKKTNKKKFFFLFFSLLWFCLCVFGFFCFHSLL